MYLDCKAIYWSNPYVHVKIYAMSQTTVQMSDEKRRRISLLIPADTDRAVNIAVLWLAVFGTLMIGSASMGLAVSNPVYLPITVAKQIIFIIIGYVFMVQLMQHFTLRLLHSQVFGLMIVGIGFLLFLASLFEFNSSGSKAWILLPIGITQVTIQPSEFAKIALILIVAAYTGDVKRTFKDENYIWKRPFFIGLIYVGIVLILQHDFGSAVVMGTLCVICIMIPSHPQLRKFQKAFGGFYLFGMLFAVFLLSPLGEPVIRHLPLEDYQISRILSAIDPFQDQYNTGYQLILGLIAFAAGGWKGLGYGASVRKYTRFPAANTDFILAIVVEELGIFGFLAIMIPYAVIVVQLFRYALKMRSEQAKIILVGVAMYIVIHALFNIGGVTGLIPLTGVPLLMISSGGSSTMALMGALGVAQAVIMRYRKGEIR